MKAQNWLTALVFPLLAGGFCTTSTTAVIGCGPNCDEYFWGYTEGEFNRYNVEVSATTPEGTAYDPSGQPISPLLIDRLTNEVNVCLTKNFPNGVIPPALAGPGYCAKGNVFSLPIDKRSFVVKVANDWVLTCDGTQQVLPKPIEEGNDACITKGQTPTQACPCRWRSGIQCPNRLITLPNFYLYKDVLIRFVTGCADPWAVPGLAECAAPSTTPLGDGTDPNNGTPQPQ